MATQASVRFGLSAIVCAAVATYCATVVFTQPNESWATAGTTTSRNPVVVLRSMKGAPSTFAVPSTASQDAMPWSVEASSAQRTILPGKAAVLVASSLAILTGAFAALHHLFSNKKGEAVALLSATGEKADESRRKMREMVDSMDSADMRMLTRGATMEDIAKSKGIDEVAAAIREEQLSRKDLTPKDVILEMQRGNGRFWMGLSERPEMTALQRRALILAQAPKICILSCSDSRVPVEIIFDQGLGEIFVVRMAGNILDANAHGSIEFSVKYLGVKVVLVIGHEGCGAVKGAITMSDGDISKEPFDLQMVLRSIKSGLDVNELNAITDMRSREREAIVLNTSNQVKRLQQNQLIAERVADGSLLVAGAFYEISSGIVDFFSLDKNGLVIDI